MKKNIFIIIFAVIALSLTACSQNNIQSAAPELKNTADGRIINVTVTIFPYFDFVRAVAGDKADITMLVKAGTEIHSYEPSPADVIKVQDADLFFYTGGDNDDWADRILASSGKPQNTVLRLMDYVTPVIEEDIPGTQDYDDDWDDQFDHDDDRDDDQFDHDDDDWDDIFDHDDDHDHDDYYDDYDEHIWTSPRNAVSIVNAITDAFCALDQNNSGYYRENAKRYIEQIAEVDNEFIEITSTSKRKLIVVADRFPFRYFVDEYGLDYKAAFGGCSDETYASAGVVAGLVNTVNHNQLPYVYYTELSNQNISRVVAEQTKAGELLLHSCQNVTKDDFENGATYVSLMKQNAVNLREGLN